jgi:trypsin
VARAGWCVAVVATLLASGVAGGPAAVAAAPGGGDVLADQTRLVAAADLIEGVGGDGYAGISLAPEKGELALYWRGTLPAEVQRTVEQVRREVVVRVLPAAHSERELLAVAQRLVKEPGVTGVGPKVDGSGLWLGYAGSVASAESVPAIRDAGVDVDVERREYMRPAELAVPSQCALMPVDRQVDWCPFSGGATFTFPRGGGRSRCTTGWPVEASGVPGGSDPQYLLTAGHCGSDGLAVTNSVSAPMGTVEKDTDSRDIMLVKAPAAASIFVGAWSSNTLKPVGGTAGNHVGEYVCTSGAVSGSHCNLRIEATNALITLTPPTGASYPVAPMVIAASHDGSVAVAGGDSGGPVTTNAFQPSSVYGVGTISGGDLDIRCPQGTVAQTTPCYQRVTYAPLQESLAYYRTPLFDLHLMTG